MSIRLITKAFDIKLGSHIKKLILIKLADNASDDGFCWPSYAKIAEQCEMSRVTVIQHIEDLIYAGYLSKTTRKISDTDMNKSNMYELSLDSGKPELLLESEKIRSEKRKAAKSGSSKSGGLPGELPTDGLPGEPCSLPSELGVVNPVNPEPSVSNRQENRNSNTPVVPLDYWDEVCPKSGKKNRAEDLRALDWSQWPGLPSVPVMRSYLKVCRTKSPMTQIVLNTFAPHLQQLSSVGISIDVALTEAITCGWQGLKYNWIAKRLDLPVFGQQQQKPQKFDPVAYVMNGGQGQSQQQGGAIDAEFHRID